MATDFRQNHQKKKFGSADVDASNSVDESVSEERTETPESLLGSLNPGAGRPSPAGHSTDEPSEESTTTDAERGSPAVTKRAPSAPPVLTGGSTVTKKIISAPFSQMEPPESEELRFAQVWRPEMETPNYIGETGLLLDYIKRQERKHRVTMPIKACGIDPILFENVEWLSVGRDGDAPEPGAEEDEDVMRVFTVPGMVNVGSENVDSADAAYELITVDGDIYMSCVSECLDPDYLTSILAEATTFVKATKHYCFEMVGFRKLALEDGQTVGRLLNTLRLNTYEMGVLCCYMRRFEGMSITYEEINGKQCICFSVE